MKIAIFHPNLMAKGGAEYVALNFIEALKDDYDLTLLTGIKPDFKELNRTFESGISEEDIKIREFPYLPMNKFKLLNITILERIIYSWARLNKSEYDLFISTKNKFWFHEPGLQYIHNPSQREHTNKGNSSLYQIYNKLCSIIRPRLKGKNVSKNISIFNSKWTKGKFKKKLGITGEIINPPVRDDFPEVSWEEREDGFVSVGRISPDKRQDFTIKVVDKLRERGFDVHLHILGGRSDLQYSKKIIKMAEKRNYVTYEGFVSREKLTQIVAGHKYGIHAKKNEHYGIAPAEMVNAGCIPFIHDSGGQKYIVNQNENLVFNDLEEAIRKIEKMLKRKKLQKETLKKLEKYEPNTPKEFQEKVKKLIGEVNEA